MPKPKKFEIRDLLKQHREAIQKLNQALLANDGERVADALELANCAWGKVEELLARRYPDFIELAEEEEEIDVEEEEEIDEVGEDGEEDDDLEEEEEETG